jgi:DNA-binding PadR family transcriptional regulator
MRGTAAVHPPSDVSQALPLTHLSFHILLALAIRDLHGYAVIKAVKQNPANPLDPGTGTFYSAISRMLDEGLITEAEPPADDSSDARRRYYAISDFGRRVLAAETRRLEQLVEFAQAAVAASPAQK